MLFKNNNSKVIRKLTNKTLRTNFTRNTFVILAIVLTTFMISSVFSIGFSFAENYQTMQLRTQGTTASITLEKPTSKQMNDLNSIGDITDVGYSISAGKISTDLLKDKETSIHLRYSDPVNWSKQTTPALSDIVGAYPEKENEIMASQWSLENLGIKHPKVGMNIDLSYTMNGKVENKSFVLSGYYKDYGFIVSSGNIMVSKAFLEKNNLTLEENGQALLTVPSNKQSTIDDTLEQTIDLKNKQEFVYSYDNAEDVSSTMVATIGVIVIIALFIVLSGYLLIYNVLYIAVTKDIRFYGLLKTIGTSPKQIKKIVRGQALRLAVIGIPIGLAVGALISFVVVPMAMSLFGSGGYGVVMPSTISFNPFIFIGAAGFSLITILISCRKPAKVAGNISPVEAARFTGIKQKKQKKKRQSKTGGKLYKMAFYNVFRDKKRAAIVFLSLFMGIITFLSVNTFLSSLSLENYLKNYMKNDFTIQQPSPVDQGIDEEIINKVKEMNGVEAVERTKVSLARLDMGNDFFLPFIKSDLSNWGDGTKEELDGYLSFISKNPDKFSSWITSVDTNKIEEINKEYNESIDIDAFERGELALVDTRFVQEKYKEEINHLNGKTFSITDEQTGNVRTYKLVIVPKFEFGTGSLISNYVGAPTIVVSHNEMKKLNEQASNFILEINVQEKYEPEIKQELKKIIANERSLLLESRSERADEFVAGQRVMNILGGGMSIILIIIGLLNFINVMVTGVNVRLKELAVMESIGMTKKQIRKMLMLEGIYYGGITAALVCTLGVAIIFGIAELTEQIADYAQFMFPIIPFISLLAVIFIVCIVTPVVVFRIVSKASVTERLKMNEH